MIGCGCLPEEAVLADLAAAARDGHRVPYVGDGSPGTVIACAHGQWRLGDVLADAPELSQEARSVISDRDLTRIVQQGIAGKSRPCAECGKPAAKGRRYCSKHANPANRKGDSDVSQGQQGDPEDDGGEGES